MVHNHPTRIRLNIINDSAQDVTLTSKMTDLQWLRIALYICPMRSLSIFPKLQTRRQWKDGPMDKPKTQILLYDRLKDRQTERRVITASYLKIVHLSLTQQMFFNEATWMFYGQTVVRGGESLINKPADELHKINFKANSPETHVLIVTCFVLGINKRISRFISNV